MEATEKELDIERQLNMKLSSPHENYQKQIEELQHNLSQKEDERSLLENRLNEVEHELKTTADDYASTTTKYESLVQQQSVQSMAR